MWIVPDTGQAHARGSHFGTPCYFPEIHGVQSCFTDHSLMYVRDKDMNVELRAQADPRDLPRNWFCSCNPLTNHTNQLWSSTGRNPILRIKFTGRVTTATLEIFPFLSEASQYLIAFITTQHTQSSIALRRHQILRTKGTFWMGSYGVLIKIWAISS